METVERVAIEIPGVKVEGTFPIKTFLEIMHNAAVKKYGVVLTVRVRPGPGEEVKRTWAGSGTSGAGSAGTGSLLAESRSCATT